jgi:hypothetical protein
MRQASDKAKEMKLIGLLLLALLSSPRLFAGEFDQCLESALSGSYKGKYQTVPMNPEYKQWDIQAHIYVFDKEERDSARLYIENGLIVDPDSKPANFGKRPYVMDSAGDFFQSFDWLLSRTKHSTFFEGAPVAGAGMIAIKNGKLRFISNSSGHYTPSPEILRQVLESLYRQGVDVSDAIVGLRGNKGPRGVDIMENAETFLFRHRDARQCIGKTLEDPETATSEGFRLYSKLNPIATKQRLQTIEKNGKLDHYASVLQPFFEKNPGFLKSLSPAAQTKFKITPCKLSLLQRLRGLTPRN